MPRREPNSVRRCSNGDNAIGWSFGRTIPNDEKAVVVIDQFAVGSRLRNVSRTARIRAAFFAWLTKTVTPTKRELTRQSSFFVSVPGIGFKCNHHGLSRLEAYVLTFFVGQSVNDA
jgi:hypothetical protein